MSAGSAAADTPWLDVYLPANNPTRTGVIVIPGGGYTYLADHEGTPIALWLQQHGVAAFVLHYRVAPYRYPVEMLDGQRALRLVRSRAAEFNISSSKIGVWGFSAGGHLASYLITQWKQTLMNPQDGVDAIDAHPDFGILAYPVISMNPAITHQGSHDNLLGAQATSNQEAKLSSELHVSGDCPPVFLFSTTDDKVVPVQNSLSFYEAYLEHHLSVEMHLFEHGSHGLGLAEKSPGPSAWPSLLAAWMRQHDWMEKEK